MCGQQDVASKTGPILLWTAPKGQLLLRTKRGEVAVAQPRGRGNRQCTRAAHPPGPKETPGHAH
jgi:hypothetical protein